MKLFMIDTMITRKAKDIKKLPDYETYDYFTEQYKWLDQVRAQTCNQKSVGPFRLVTEDFRTVRSKDP